MQLGIALTACLLIMGTGQLTYAQPVRFEQTNWPGDRAQVSRLSVDLEGNTYALANAYVYSTDEGRRWHFGGPGLVTQTNGHRFLKRGSELSIEEGSGWTSVLTGIREIVGDEIHGRVYALGAVGASTFLYRSSDGRRWDTAYSVNQDLRYGMPLTVDNGSGRVFLLVGAKLMASDDGGANWRSICDSMPAGFPPWIAMLPGRLIAARESGAVIESMDSGRTWHPATVPSHTDGTSCLRTAPGGRAYLGTVNGSLYRTRDSGATWEKIDDDAFGRQINDVLELSDATLLVATDGAGIQRRSPSDSAWQQSSAGLAGERILGIAAQPSGRIYATDEGSKRFFMSDTRGATWIVDSLPSMALHGVGVTPSGATLIGTHARGVARSATGDRPWILTVNGLPSDYDRTIYGFTWWNTRRIWASGFGLYISEDDGFSWAFAGFQGQGAGVPVHIGDSIIVVPTGPFAYTPTYIQRSTDAGYSFSVANTGLKAVPITTTIPYTLLALADNSVLAACDSGLFRSVDSGQTWQQVATDVPGTGFGQPVRDRWGTVYVPASGAVFVSRDTCRTWTKCTEGLGGSVRCLALDSAGFLYVGTIGAGVLRSVVPVAEAESARETERAELVTETFVTADPEVRLHAVNPRGTPITAEIVAVDGRLLGFRHAAFTDGRVDVDISMLPTGFYLVRLMADHRLVGIARVIRMR